MTVRIGLMVFLLVLALAVRPSSQELRDINTKWTVDVVNGLSGENRLFLHCKSKDDDLGMHDLPVGAKSSWSFKENLFGRTLYWCYLRKDKAHAAFDVFWEEKNEEYYLLRRTCDRSNICIWIAKDDGIYLKSIRDNLDVFMHRWKPGQ
ncbi:S-protein homolog 1-like [Alnus glutinosa]|jgi:hypothetical protein|uniref:S-protein homolog 1-like n=1 Tax=Alnus glutinosa TaxID=3517 RepID=UPI002D774ABC|nr:S-protein homolog 1-like [Alnus glutinosa]